MLFIRIVLLARDNMVAFQVGILLATLSVGYRSKMQWKGFSRPLSDHYIAQLGGRGTDHRLRAVHTKTYLHLATNK